MATTKATLKDLACQLQNKASRGRIKTLLDAIVDKVDAVVAASAGYLTADAAGRAVFADSFWTEAAVTAKFVAQSITGAILKNNTVTPTQLATVVMGAPTARSGAGAVPITAPDCLLTTTGSAQALTVADGTYSGQRLTIRHIVDGGSGVITQTTGAKLRADITTITFTNVGDWVTLVWTGTLWTPVQGYGVTIATS